MWFKIEFLSSRECEKSPKVLFGSRDRQPEGKYPAQKLYCTSIAVRPFQVKALHTLNSSPFCRSRRFERQY
jgi:hypothetical protein